MSVIECKAFTKKFGTKTALNHVTFTIEQDKIIGLIGRNGAGKTTLLKAIAGHIKTTEGELKLWGEEVFDNLNVLYKLIFVGEELQYEPGKRLKDLLELGRLYYENWDMTFAQKLLKHFELNPNAKYGKLSRGMKSQFNMIMGLSCRVPLTLFDEPTLGLDAAVRKEFYNILLRDYSEHPRTMIISSHLLGEIENLLEEIVLLKEGELALHKPVEVLQEYGVYLNGKSDVLLPFIQKKEVLNTETFGNSVIAAVRNDLDEQELAYLQQNNVDISKVRVEDVCIFLTRKEKGGASDDFDRE